MSLLLLHPGEGRRLTPFAALYAVLFAALALADGLSTALFVESVGAASLPKYNAMTAVVNVVVLGVYLLLAEWAGSVRTFQAILAALAAGALALGPLGAGGYGWLFVLRETAYLLVLLHFGTYLQRYFTRDQMTRVLPLVYAGGRVGGILGGLMLEWLPIRVLLILLAGLLLFCAAAIELLAWTMKSPEAAAEAKTPMSPAEEAACASWGSFLLLVWRSRLLFWLSLTSAVFLLARLSLVQAYNLAFADVFDGPEALAAFLGRYTQIAFAVALVIQVLAVSRLVAWLGSSGTMLLYAALVALAAFGSAASSALAVAALARFVETELRLGLRNPAAQLLTNEFSRRLRTRVRAWTLGVLVPAGTLVAAGLIAVGLRAEVPPGLMAAVGSGLFLATCVGLAFAARVRPPADSPSAAGAAWQGAGAPPEGQLPESPAPRPAG